MPFRIVFSEEAESQLKKINNQIVIRIMEKMNDASENPIHFFERLVGRDEYKLRVGEYRLIANIFFNEKMVLIRLVGHRKSIYK